MMILDPKTVPLWKDAQGCFVVRDTFARLEIKNPKSSAIVQYELWVHAVILPNKDGFKALLLNTLGHTHVCRYSAATGSWVGVGPAEPGFRIVLSADNIVAWKPVETDEEYEARSGVSLA